MDREPCAPQRKSLPFDNIALGSPQRRRAAGSHSDANSIGSRVARAVILNPLFYQTWK
jgi:hypothetical protein